MVAPIGVSYRWLLGLYAIVPVSVLVVLLDRGFFGSSLQRALPLSPEDLRLFTVFFHLPHIVASFLIFLDREYLQSYGKKLGLGIPLIIFGTFLLALGFGGETIFIAMVVSTSYHVVMQQVGLTRGLLREASKSFEIWKWLFLVVAVTIYFFLFLPRTETYLEVKRWTDPVLAVSVLAMGWFSWRIGASSLQPRGVAYLWANTFLIGAAYLSYLLGYPFFAILMTRVIHDLTAFGFYTVHNYNRNQPTVRNVLFKLPGQTRVLLPFWTPLLAVAVAYPLWEMKGWNQGLNLIVIAIIFIHYFTEHFTWRKGTLHRQFASIS